MVDRVVMIHLSVRLALVSHMRVSLMVRNFFGYAIPSISGAITND